MSSRFGTFGFGTLIYVTVNDSAIKIRSASPVYGPELVIEEALEENTAGCVHTGKAAHIRRQMTKLLTMLCLTKADAYCCAAAGKLTRTPY